MDILLRQFDEIIDDAPVDFVGINHNTRFIEKEEREWRQKVEAFRKKLADLIKKG